MQRMLLIGVLAWMPATALGQQIYKCVADGQVSYQSMPCADGREPARTWDHGSYAPPVPTPQPAARQERKGPSTARVREYRDEARQARRGRPDRCESARRQREARLQAERIGRRSMELRRKLDRMVAEACQR